MILNKIDLLPFVPFDLDACVTNARHVNPRLRIFETSAILGDGLDDWCDWLLAQLPAPLCAREASP